MAKAVEAKLEEITGMNLQELADKKRYFKDVY